MSGLGFENFRRPVEYVLNQELRKRNLKNKLIGSNTDNTNLQEYPVELIRNSEKKVTKILYGVGLKQWSEELIRDSNGKVYRIKTTYPDGSTKTIQINKGSDNLVDNIDYV